MNNNNLIQPFLKWAGGKRQLLNEIEKYYPEKVTTYYEPFLGGGAVLFNFTPMKAVVNDINSDLIRTYEVIRDNPIELIEDLRKHENNSDYFYEIRNIDRTQEYSQLTDIEKSSRLIYLNKTCYNGLFRVNSKGEFNTPFGKYKKPNIVNEDIIFAVSKYLNKSNIKFLNTDFEEVVKNARKGSFVYFDPPYQPISDSSYFTGYNLDGFNENDQIRLKKLCDKLNRKGVKFLLSNSSAPLIMDLYKDYEIIMVDAKRSINSKGNGRGEIKEVLVRNYG